MYADQKKLARIIQNLISNAVKYSERRLEFQVDAKEDGTISAEQNEESFVITLVLKSYLLKPSAF